MNFLWIYRLFLTHFTSGIHFFFTEIFQIFYFLNSQILLAICRNKMIFFELILHDMNETTARPGRNKGEYNLPEPSAYSFKSNPPERYISNTIYNGISPLVSLCWCRSFEECAGLLISQGSGLSLGGWRIILLHSTSIALHYSKPFIYK